MKKTLLFFCALLMLGISGVKAQTPVTSITSGNTYYLFNSCFSQYVNSSLNTDASPLNAIKFTLTGSDGNYNIYSSDKGGYLTWGTLNNGAAPTISATTSENTLWTIDVQSGSIMNIYPKGQTSKELISQSGTAGKPIALWDFGNQGGQWYIYEASDFETIFETSEFAAAAASITSGSIYRIFTQNNGTSEGSTKYYLTTDGTLSEDVNEAGNFTLSGTVSTAFAPAGKAWKIKNGTTRFTNRPYRDTGQTHINTTTGNDRDTYEAQVFFLNGSGKYAIRSTNNATSGSDYVENAYWTVVPDATGDDIPDATYDDTNVGTKHYVWQFEKTSVTFNLIYGGNTLASTALLRSECIGTATLPDASWNNPYCIYEYSPATITEETETVNITMTWDGPFTFSSDYASATWYNMSLRNKWAAYSASGTPYPLYSTKSDATSQTRESMWAFIGDPYNGVRVINRKVGNGMYLSSYVTFVSNIGDAVFDFYADEYTLWTIGTNNNGFTLHSGSDRYLYDTGNESKLRILQAAGAGGAGETGASLVVSAPTFCDLALAYLDEYAENHAVGEYFGLTESSVSELHSSIETAGDDITESVYTETTIPTIEALWPGTDNANVYYPPTGQYLIHSKGRTPNRYMQIDDTGKPVTTATNDGVGNVVTLTALDNHKYKIQMQGLNLDAPVYSGDFLDMTASNEGAVFDTFVLLNGVGFKSGNNWNYIHPRNSGTYGLMCYWGPATDAASAWVIEDATSITISLNDVGGTYYATTYLPFDVSLQGDAVKAYAITVSGSYAVPTEIGSNIPAGTAVLLKGTAESVTANITRGLSSIGVSNILNGTYQTVEGGLNGNYVLANGSEGIGFYKLNGTLSANRAYLPSASVSASVKGLLLNWDDADGIQTIGTASGAKENADIYNLAGQRMSRVQKGVNIVNGKKVLVK